jgi:predicted ATP-dependent endonuclease of OLD family
MLSSIRISNYRGFKDCKVRDLGRVNIFAGMNNSGKTTLLEALFLWSAAGNPQFAFNPIVVRVDVPVERVLLPAAAPNMMPAAGYMWSTAWQPMFHSLATETPIKIVGAHESLGTLELTISTERSKSVVLSPNADTNEDHPDDLLFRYGRSGDGELCLIRIKTQGTQYDVEGAGEVEVHLQSIFEGMYNIAIDVERLSKLKKEKADASVLKAIQMVDASVKSIEIGIMDGRAVILADVGLSDRLPLRTLGAGPQRIATLATSAAAAAGGLLLIDEFDAGLHYSKLGDVWRALHAIAVDRDVQVFATTHSYECVRAADEVLSDGEPRFYRLQDGQVTSYPPDVLTDAIAAGMEVR